jgi:hypothetical protein
VTKNMFDFPGGPEAFRASIAFAEFLHHRCLRKVPDG